MHCWEPFNVSSGPETFIDQFEPEHWITPSLAWEGTHATLESKHVEKKMTKALDQFQR